MHVHGNQNKISKKQEKITLVLINPYVKMIFKSGSSYVNIYCLLTSKWICLPIPV